MKYKGKELLLDNFRTLLSGYSVDVQDVVRSAIFDNVDISKYIDKCRNNPYRLDQIRLGKKEGISEEYFKYKSGEVIRGIRGLLKQGVDLSVLKKYNEGGLSDKCFLYLIYWCRDGYDCSRVNFSIIPDYQLDFFDFCFRNKVDVSLFNQGLPYSLDYLSLCSRIIENGCRYDKYANFIYDIDVISLMVRLSNLPSRNKYDALYSVLDEDIEYDMLIELEKGFSLGIDVKGLYGLGSLDVIRLVNNAREKGIDLLEYAEGVRSYRKIKERFNEEMLNSERVLSGRLVKK